MAIALAVLEAALINLQFFALLAWHLGQLAEPMVLAFDEIANIGHPIAPLHFAMPIDHAVNILALVSVRSTLPLTMPMEQRVVELA